MSDPRPYTPIDCGLIDELQLRAMRRMEVEIEWRAGAEVRSGRGTPADTQSRGGVEYLILTDGLEIRMDDLIRVDGIPFDKSCQTHS